MGFWSDFKKFISKGNIVDLATAVVIGNAFNKIVTGLVNNIIMPVVSLAVGGLNVSDWKYVIKDAVLNEAGEVVEAETAILYGDFIQSILDFLIVALCIFTALRILMKTKRRSPPRKQRRRRRRKRQNWQRKKPRQPPKPRKQRKRRRTPKSCSFSGKSAILSGNNAPKKPSVDPKGCASGFLLVFPDVRPGAFSAPESVRDVSWDLSRGFVYPAVLLWAFSFVWLEFCLCNCTVASASCLAGNDKIYISGLNANRL